MDSVFRANGNEIFTIPGIIIFLQPGRFYPVSVSEKRAHITFAADISNLQNPL